MRLQWKYFLIINLTVIAVLVAFYFFDSYRLRKEMSTIHALGAEQGAAIKLISENTILQPIVKEITSSQAFNPDRIDQVINKLKDQHPETKDVLNVEVTLGDARVRSSLLSRAIPTHIHLAEAELLEIETKGAITDTIEEKNAAYIILPYTIQPKKLDPTHLESQSSLKVEDIPMDFWQTYLSIDRLNQGKFSFELWRMFIANQIYLSPDTTVKIDLKTNRWHISDSVNKHTYDFWQEDDTFWIHMSKINSGYIRILYDVPSIANVIRSSLLMHAIFIVIVGILLMVLFHLMTNKLIIKPLARMTNIIQNAETGNLSSYIKRTYASDEINKATRNLVRMFTQLKTSHSRKIAALGQFAGGVAHEIRNPLNSIGMTAQHLKSIFSQPDVKPEDIEEAKELLDIVVEKIGELKQTSEQFLTLNRPQKLNLTTVNLNQLLNSVLSEFTLIAENANVHINEHYNEDLPDLQLDEMLMRQTIYNFVQNCIQAMPKGGSIYLTTSVEIISGANYVSLEIRDTGIGIPEENQERIYDAYFTTKDEDGGIGLGLAISHQIITAHQGNVEVRSKIGMGTAFKITFPVRNIEIN